MGGFYNAAPSGTRKNHVKADFPGRSDTIVKLSQVSLGDIEVLMCGIAI